MHRNYGVHGLFRSSGVTGVTLRLGVQTDDVRCVVALFFRHGMRGHHGTARFIFYSIVGRTPCGCPFRSSVGTQCIASEKARPFYGHGSR